MFKHAILFAAVVGLVFAMTPAAQAVTVQVYKETFVGTTSGEALTLNTGWAGSGKVGTATYFTSTAPPDASDAWFARWYEGSSSCHTWGTTAEYTILGTARIGTTFKVDWARGINNGAKFIAKVGGIWYGSETFGTGAGDHGTVSGSNISTWAQDTTVNVETANWYAVVNSPFGTYNWRDNTAWSTTPTPLPAGTITEFGFIAYNASNNQVFAMDNFRVVRDIAPTTAAASTDWNLTTTWDTSTVPTSITPVIVDSTNAVTIPTAPANCWNLTLSGTGSVSATGQTLTIASPDISALNTPVGTLLALDATSTLNIAKANTSASFAGLTVASGTILNVTSELTVDANKDLSGATINTPKVTLAGGTLTKSDGLTIGSGNLISGTGTVVGAVTVASGGRASPGTSIGSFTVSGLTLASGSLLTMEAASTISGDLITVSDSGGLTINGGAVTFLDGTGTAPQTTIGTYNLIAYSGAIGGTGVSALTVSNPVAGRRYGFGASGSNVALDVTQGPVWSDLVGGGLWSVPANWSGVTPVSTDTLVYAAGGSGSSVNDLSGASFQSIQFNSGVNAFTLSGNKVILTGFSGEVVLNNSSNLQTLSLPIEINAPLAVNTASGAVELSGQVSGTGTLVKTGTNALTLSGNNVHTGGVTLSAGTLNINSTTALGATAGAFTISGGTIDNTTAGAIVNANSNPQAWNGNFTFTGTQDLNLGTGAVTMNAARTVTVNGSKTLTIGGPITGAGLALTKTGNNDAGTMVVSSVGSSFGALTLTRGTLRLDNSVAASPTMTVTSTTLNNDNNWKLLDINNATLTTGGINVQRGQVVVRGTSVINNTGGARITESADSNAKSYYFKDSAIINGGTGNLETSYTQAAQSTYIMMQNSAQATFANVILGPNAEYADSTGHNTVLEVKDTAQLTIPGTGNMYVMQRINDQNRTGLARVHMQVYQHGGTVTVGGNLRLCDNDPIKGSSAPVHQVDGAYNLGAGSSLKVGGTITGGATRTGVGQSYFNFHGGTLTYTGAGPQTDWINLTASAITDGIDSTQNLRLWEGGTIDTGTQNVTINQAILAPTGQGVSAISTAGLTGTVYNNGTPPWVFITRDTVSGDTTGSGASAVPTLNAAGNITGFTITNPGNNYTVKPLITLIRGDLGTPGTVPAGNITLSDNSSYTGGLTKQGTGILTLTGANTYTGDTTVTDGTLSVSTAFFGDLSTINIASGGILNLNHASMDTILYLYLAGNQQSSGIYSLALGNASPYLSGGGSLNVTMPEPATMALMALGGLGLILGRKRR